MRKWSMISRWKHRSQVIAEPPLALVGPGQLAGQELGPEFLEDLVGQVLVADLQVDVSRDGIVVPADQVFMAAWLSGPGVWALLIVVQLVGIWVSRSSAISLIH